MAAKPDSMLRIGLTGGIASGKSLVADCFAELGVPVIDTDEIAREVVEPGQPALAEIRAEFGAEVFAPDGTLDRAAMRRLVFDDPQRRQALEAILHPRIRAETLDRADRAAGPYQILVVPLLIESGFDRLTDRVLVVDCPRELQESRLRSRDAEDSDRIKRILAAQLPREARLRAADDVIDNSGSIEATRRQVAALHRRYLEICGQRCG